MANFHIKKGATLPVLFMKPYLNTETGYQKFNTMMKDCAVTFSMVNIDTGTYKIANKEGGVYIREKTIHSSHPYKYYIYYQFTEKDTNTPGIYRGEFKIDFMGDECPGGLIVPIQDTLYIHVLDSIVKTTVI